MTPSSNNTQQQELMTETLVLISWKLQEKNSLVAFTLQWVGIKHLRAIVCFVGYQRDDGQDDDDDDAAVFWWRGGEERMWWLPSLDTMVYHIVRDGVKE